MTWYKKENKKKKYDRCPWTMKEYLKNIGWLFLLGSGIGWIFYQEIWGMVVFLLAVLPVGLHMKCREAVETRRNMLGKQFSDCIRMVSGNLAAGYAMENAWIHARGDLEAMYGVEADMCRELREFQVQLEMNQSIEHILTDFSARCGIEDVEQFCQIFSYAKRNGGNLTGIIGDTVQRMGEKQEIYQEIDTVLAAGKLEQRIMNVIPLVILGYVNISSPDFTAGLYHNWLGRLIMTGCLGIYGIAYWWSGKLIRIEV